MILCWPTKVVVVVVVAVLQLLALQFLDECVDPGLQTLHGGRVGVAAHGDHVQHAEQLLHTLVHEGLLGRL